MCDRLAWRPFLVASLLCAGWAFPSGAMELADLDPGVVLYVRDVTVEGNETYWSWTLSDKISTHARAWYAPWRDRPELDPFALENDLERLKRFYESEGYWHMKTAHELVVEGDEVDVTIRIDEGERAFVGSVTTRVADLPTPPELSGEVPLESGDPFVESDYQEGETTLKRFFLERSYAQVTVKRKATLDLDRNLADAEYVVTAGEKSRFGSTTITGTEDIEPRLVRREIEWAEGDPFLLEPIDRTRNRLLDLGLFGSVRIGWEPEPEAPDVSRMLVEVEEQPPRRIKVGAGYGTADEIRGLLEWKHFNWLGGGRQLAVALKGSTITRSILTTFTQPHFGTRDTKGILQFREEQEDEETFTLLATEFAPRIEHAFTGALSASLGYRFLFAKLSDVDGPVAAAIGGVDEEGFLSGPSLGFVHDTTENPFDPRSGHVVTLRAWQAGEVFGGDFHFYRLTGEAKQYVEIGFDTVLAARVKAGAGDTLRDVSDYPVFERYYAGGERSVRGYGRRRLGPLSSSDRALGGLSLIEGAVELRRSLYGPVGGVLFFDFGQVSLDEFDFPVDDLEYAAGPGIAVGTPIGPLALFLGIPFDPPAGDSSWQVHFSIGQFF